MEKPKFKTVQEVLAAGEGLPERYLREAIGGDDGDRDFNASLPEMDIPAVDLCLLLSSSAPAGTDETVKLRSALARWGVVQVINHGMTQDFLNQVHEVTEQFFALPMEEKQKYAREIGSIEGYGNDMILSDDQILDWTDRLFLTTYPEDERKLQFWPQIPAIFRETLLEYTHKLKQVNEQFLKAMARSLEIDENCFLEMYGENGMMSTRFNLYPPCPKPDKVLGVKPHADGSTITVLLPDKQVEGLQFLKDNQWFKAPILRLDALLINVGDQIEIMSNGIFKSPVHRVVTNRKKERISVATFYSPGPDREVEPVGCLVDETRPRLYKTVKKYVDIYFQYYQQGRRPIEAAMI